MELYDTITNSFVTTLSIVDDNNNNIFGNENYATLLFQDLFSLYINELIGTNKGLESADFTAYFK